MLRETTIPSLPNMPPVDTEFRPELAKGLRRGGTELNRRSKPSTHHTNDVPLKGEPSLTPHRKSTQATTSHLETQRATASHHREEEHQRLGDACAPQHQAQPPPRQHRKVVREVRRHSPQLDRGSSPSRPWRPRTLPLRRERSAPTGSERHSMRACRRACQYSRPSRYAYDWPCVSPFGAMAV